MNSNKEVPKRPHAKRNAGMLRKYYRSAITRKKDDVVTIYHGLHMESTSLASQVEEGGLLLLAITADPGLDSVT